MSHNNSQEDSAPAVSNERKIGAALLSAGRGAGLGQPQVEFPLTPALSPGERENLAASSQAPPIEKLGTRRVLSTLPEGEGETVAPAGSLVLAPSRLRRILFAPVKFFWGMAA